jgi:regulator of protease activity HflC (stomatin/prohibitin superfamily)
VVSAEIERGTRAARARADREAALPAAEAEAIRETREADGDAARRLADAHGAVAGFLAAFSAKNASPDLFQFRRRLEAVEEALTDRRLFVVDHRLRTAAGDLCIDLRSRGSDSAGAEKSPNVEKRR